MNLANEVLMLWRTPTDSAPAIRLPCLGDLWRQQVFHWSTYGPSLAAAWGASATAVSSGQLGAVTLLPESAFGGLR